MNPVIFLLALAGANSGIAMRVVDPMLPRLAEEFSTDVPTAARVVTVFALFYALAQLLHGLLGDRFGKLRVITVMLLLSMIAFAGCAVASDLDSLVAWRAITGVVSSASVMLGMAYIGDEVPLDVRAPVIAHYMAGNVLGHALGPFIGGLLIDLAGWRATFLFVSLVFGGVGATLYFKTRAHWAGEPRAVNSLVVIARYADILKSAHAVNVCLCGLVETFFFFGAFSYVGALVKERFDTSYTIIGVILSGFGIGGLLFAASVKWLMKRLDADALVALGGAVVLVCYAATALSASWWPLLGWVTALGYGFNMLHNILQVRATEMAPQARGIGMSVFSATWIFGQGLGVAAMGVGVASFGYTTPIITAGIGFALLGLWMVASFRPATDERG
jgi:predicted MFS family arabinose efflux permease